MLLEKRCGENRLATTSSLAMLRVTGATRELHEALLPPK